jgi:hypothetical protein
MYQEKYFYLCEVPLNAGTPDDVIILKKAANTSEFPDLFKDYEDLRSHAFNEDGLFSVIRADKLHIIVRMANDALAKEAALEESTPNLITNLQHRVMQSKDKKAQKILKEIHEIETDIH